MTNKVKISYKGISVTTTDPEDPMVVTETIVAKYFYLRNVITNFIISYT